MNLFDPFSLRDLRLRNRIAVSPMCQYSAVDGLPNQWHHIHLGSRAVGGAGMVITEATAVDPRGRISPSDTGLWNDEHTEAWAPIVAFIESNGAVPAIQLAHAGRKASVAPPWLGGCAVSAEKGGWTPVAPSQIAFDEKYLQPEALDEAGIQSLIDAFRASALRALDAGFRVIELHAAHGYLLHEFLSPLSNRRADDWGGSFAARARLTLEVVRATRGVWPERLPLFVRISATDWVEGGWDIEQSVELARLLKSAGVDLVDVSSGGLSPLQKIELNPGYQVPFAARIRREAAIATGAVGLITEPSHANEIVEQGAADLVLLGRELLRDPYWPRRAAHELGATLDGPPQYARAW
jgi:2,4-dienoyl-CoA reductase-like NADH-dependent reductase (Old Yellow Enzyme family)